MSVPENADSLEKLADDYGLAPEGVRYAIEQYQEFEVEEQGAWFQEKKRTT